MELVAFVSPEQGMQGQLIGVINHGDWESIILVGRTDAKNFSSKKECDFIEITSGSIVDLKEELKKKLQEKIKGIEVALSISSGSGKEHMALISALLSLPVGIRFVVYTKDGLVYM